MKEGRPKTLADVAIRVLAGASFRLDLADFLDEFYESPNEAALAGEPPFLNGTGERGKQRDAF